MVETDREEQLEWYAKGQAARIAGVSRDAGPVNELKPLLIQPHTYRGRQIPERHRHRENRKLRWWLEGWDGYVYLVTA